MATQPLQASNTKPLDVGNGQEAEEEELKLSAATEMAIKGIHTPNGDFKKPSSAFGLFLRILLYGKM
nr:unnamed protein product [Haemonchus contortus]